MNTKHSQYKCFLKLKTEWDNLYDQKRNMPYVKVEPFQSGWLCNVVLKPQYLTIEGLSEAIDIGYRTKKIYRVKDVKNIRNGLVMFGTGKYITNYFPDKIKIKPIHYEKLCVNIKIYFRKEYSEQLFKGDYHVINVKDYFLKLQVRPNMFNYIQQINPDIESRLTELNEIFEQNQFWNKFKNHSEHRDYNINIRQDFKKQLTKFKIDQIESIENNKFKLGWS